MLAFLLGLLKVIGIILLVIFLLVLFLLGIVLFVPIRYTGSGVIDETRKEVRGKVTWLLHAVSVSISYAHPDKPSILIKILGINIEKFKKKPKKEKKHKAKKTAKADITFEKVDNAEDSVYNDTIPSGETEEAPSQEPLTQEHRTIVEDYIAEKEKPKESFKEKINNIVNKITSVYNKLKDILQNIQYYIDILQENETKALLTKALEALLKILKSIRPRKLIVNAEVGFETPDTTGKMYGVYWMLKPILGEHVEIAPNFEEKIIKGDFYVKGKITLFVIAINGLKILLNKNFKPVINKLKNGGKKNGRENK